MGKASKWFRSILGLKKPDPTTNSSSPTGSKQKRRWSFVKSYREKDDSQHTTAKRNTTSNNNNNISSSESDDANKHAIAVAAATAAVAEAAVAAAQAAAAVVKLTSTSGRCGNYQKSYVISCDGGGGGGTRSDLAAIKIQSAFRGYLARRALRALRGLVRLQALVRGHIERKKNAERFRRMQAVLRAQARARAGRSQLSESSQSSSKSSHFNHPDPPTPEKLEQAIRSKSTNHEVSSAFKRNGSKSNGRVSGDHDKARVGWNWSDRRVDDRSHDQRGHLMRIGNTDDEKSDKILEIDTGKPIYLTSKRRNHFHHTVSSDQYSHSFTVSKDSTTHQNVPSTSSCEVQSLSPLKFSHEIEDSSFCTAENSPQFYSASSRGGSSKRSPFTPTKSCGSDSYLSGYSDHPNYMAYTESSRAKLRSMSAPRQRPQYLYDRSSSTKRYSVHGLGESKSGLQKVSTLHANFTNKAYPGSGRLDRLGMPVGQRY